MFGGGEGGGGIVRACALVVGCGCMGGWVSR